MQAAKAGSQFQIFS